MIILKPNLQITNAQTRSGVIEQGNTFQNPAPDIVHLPFRKQWGIPRICRFYDISDYSENNHTPGVIATGRIRGGKS